MEETDTKRQKNNCAGRVGLEGGFGLSDRAAGNL